MIITDEQIEEIRAAATLWKGFLSGLQRNVILTDERKTALTTLVALAEEVLNEDTAAKTGP